MGVRGGGCSGFQYSLALDEQRDGDQVFEHEGIRVLVDPASLRYVDGSTVDYTESLMGAGFEVQNPNVVASCGCGSSFRVKDDEDAAACASRHRSASFPIAPLVLCMGMRKLAVPILPARTRPTRVG